MTDFFHLASKSCLTFGSRTSSKPDVAQEVIEQATIAVSSILMIKGFIDGVVWGRTSSADVPTSGAVRRDGVDVVVTGDHRNYGAGGGRSGAPCSALV